MDGIIDLLGNEDILWTTISDDKASVEFSNRSERHISLNKAQLLKLADEIREIAEQLKDDVDKPQG